MCLHLTELLGRKPKKAIKDIVVYKHVIMHADGTFETTYQKVPIEIPAEMTSKLELRYVNGVPNAVETALHSFKRKDAAVRDAAEEASWLWGTSNVVVIVKCIIPKGATYYEGSFSVLHAMASDKLNYVKVLTTIIPKRN